MRYSIDDEEAQFNPEAMVNAPLASVVAGVVSNAVAAEPLPVVPAAYTWTLAPEIGCVPASTLPETNSDGVVVGGVVVGGVVGGVVVGGVVGGVVVGGVVVGGLAAVVSVPQPVNWKTAASTTPTSSAAARGFDVMDR
jgi:hypothetical protein